MQINKYTVALSSGLLFVLICFTTVSANPIPVYPHPQPISHGLEPPTSDHDLILLVLIYIIDFTLDLLILYGTLLLFEKRYLLDMMEIFSFRTKKVVASTVIVSLIGFFSEILLGNSIGGLCIVLVLVFVSFALIAFYILKLDRLNALRLGVIATIINILLWLVIFTI
jgi:hypothetical protein